MSNERRRFRRSYRLHYGTQIYQDKNKTKGSVNLLELINLGDEIREEICDIYMEGQYHGFCKYLLECMEDVDQEFDKLPQKDYSLEKSVHPSR